MAGHESKDTRRTEAFVTIECKALAVVALVAIAAAVYLGLVR